MTFAEFMQADVPIQGYLIVAAALFVIGVLVLGVTQAALSGVYSAALYRYAVSHEAPAEFRDMALESAFARK